MFSSDNSLIFQAVSVVVFLLEKTIVAAIVVIKVYVVAVFDVVSKWIVPANSTQV
jgi:hypothetical protein